jgi:hypothetical protein
MDWSFKQPLPSYWHEMVAVAERVSNGTDLLRLGFLGNKDRFFVGEATPFSAAHFSEQSVPESERAIIRQFVDGIVAREICSHPTWPYKKGEESIEIPPQKMWDTG